MGVDTKWLAKQQETRMSDTTVTITSETFEYMADRIEELEANLAEQIEWVKQLADDLIAAEGREARLEEKLEKAVEALVELNKISKRAVKLSQEHDEFRLWAMEPMWQATALANTTLAELTGGKDDQ